MECVWCTSDGKRTKTITIAADDPEALAAAIHQSSATVGMQVRVAKTSDRAQRPKRWLSQSKKPEATQSE